MGSETAPDWVAARLNRSPIRKQRRKYYNNLTEFQRKLGIQYSVAYFTECGCYGKIPDTIIKAFASKGVDIPSLRQEYREFQKDCRQEFGEYFRDILLSESFNLVLERVYPSTSFVKLLQDELGMSRAELAKWLCIQTAILYRLEKGQTKEFPDDLVDALYQAGISHDVIRRWNYREGRK